MAVTVDVPRLCEELIAAPIAKVNNVLPLLKSLSAEGSNAALIIRALRLFFEAAQDEHAFLQTQAAPGASDAEARFREWLLRRHATYVAALRGFLCGDTPPHLQAAALAALMEDARRRRPGRLDAASLAATLAGMLHAPAPPEAALAALAARYAQYADVRYHTLRTLRKIANAQRGSGEEPAAKAAPAAVVRNVHSLLVRIPGGFPPPAQPDEDGNQEAGEAAPAPRLPSAKALTPKLQPLQAWSAAGAVRPAVDRAEGSRRRRKRRREEAGSDPGAPAGTAGCGAQGIGKGHGAAPPPAAAWANLRLQRRAWSSAWLALLRLPLPRGLLMQVLAALPGGVLPHLADPLLLGGFLSRALDCGGLAGMLALDGLFTLVSRHGLEYPHFYARLYSLLTPAALVMGRRARFWALADAFLASGLVPAYTAAAVAKRLARLALSAPPAGALLALGFVHNLLRRHPACTVLLHRPTPPAGSAAAAPATPSGPKEAELQPGTDGEEPRAAALAAPGDATEAAPRPVTGGPGGEAPGLGAVWQGEDVYDAKAEDPAAARALESSLWELAAMRHHYCPQVASAAAALLSKDLTDRRKTAEVDITPLAAASAVTLLGSELKKRLRRPAPAAFHADRPNVLFGPAWADDALGWVA